MNAPFVSVCRLAVMKGSGDFGKTLPILPRSQISLSLCKFARKSRGPLRFATRLSFCSRPKCETIQGGGGAVFSVNLCLYQLEFQIFGFRHLWQNKILDHFSGFPRYFGNVLKNA